MKIKNLACAALLATVATGSFAASGDASFADLVANFDQRTDPDATLFDGRDEIVFTDLALGTYEFSLDFSGQNLNIDSLTLNGQAATLLTASRFTFGSLESTGVTPFVLAIEGWVTRGQVGSYSGSLQVAAPVPEPESYALMLAGLGAVGFIARRRRGQ